MTATAADLCPIWRAKADAVESSDQGKSESHMCCAIQAEIWTIATALSSTQSGHNLFKEAEAVGEWDQPRAAEPVEGGIDLMPRTCSGTWSDTQQSQCRVHRSAG